MFRTLSGRFLILTIAFVMLAEVLIFVPSIARFRSDFLSAHLDRAQIASLALLANDMISDELEAELLSNAGVYNVVLRRDEMRELVLSSSPPFPVGRTYDLSDASAWTLVQGALNSLAGQDPEVIRIIGVPLLKAGLMIEVTMDSAPLRSAIIDYGLRILYLSAFISIITAALLFVAVRWTLVRPIKRVVTHMIAYAHAPQDIRRIIEPNSRIVELREAEDALKSLQSDLTTALRQKQRLAQLGEAVAKISHDLRNILTSVQLFSDRLEAVDDPSVKRLAPKLMNSVSRAISLTEGTLAFGKAEEPAPMLQRFDLFPFAQDILDNESILSDEAQLRFLNNVPGHLSVRADPEQLYRAVTNLVRNARQALISSKQTGTISIGASDDNDMWFIDITDTGPGLPLKAQEHLFQPFQGGVRKGGIGLGLAIAQELVQGHGGSIALTQSSPSGTSFRISLPKGAI